MSLSARIVSISLFICIQLSWKQEAPKHQATKGKATLKDERRLAGSYFA